MVWTLESRVQINDWSQVFVSVLTGIQWWEVGRYVKIKYVKYQMMKYWDSKSLHIGGRDFWRSFYKMF